jgi:NADH-quinone oxidoreductase subunit H
MLTFIFWVITQVFLFLSSIISVLIGVAYFTLAERKVMAMMQRRIGPNCVGYWGAFQPLADGLKLVVKQFIIPNKVQTALFTFAPVYTLTLAFSAWSVIPYASGVVIDNIDLGVIYLLAISTLSVYGLILAGWSSNSKYAFLGSLRAAAQMISYDVSLGLILLSIIIFVGSGNLTEIVFVQESLWFVVPFWPLALMFFISGLAETNRAPFDLTEAEAELVAGYNVEYSGVGFAMFFIAEYTNMLLMSLYFSLLFLGGWGFFSYVAIDSDSIVLFFILGLKTVFVAFCFVWVRATLPRYRYDQLMVLGWKVFLPLALSSFMFFTMVSVVGNLLF